MTENLAILCARALNTQGDNVPDLVEIIPSGPEIIGRDGRKFTLDTPDTVLRAFAQHRADLPVDFEHATEVKAPKGEIAPACGWIKELRISASRAIEARIEWNEAGREAIANKSYRYVSPVFLHSDDEEARIIALLSLALTNQPNLYLRALNRATPQTPNETEAPNMEKIAQALGLNPNAPEADLISAINTLKEEHATEMHCAATPDPEKFIPKDDYVLACQQRDIALAEQRAAREARIEQVVNDAIAGGKVAPNSRQYHMEACRQAGGLERFEETYANAAQILPDSGLAGKDAPGAHVASNAQVAICRQLGLDATKIFKGDS